MKNITQKFIYTFGILAIFSMLASIHYTKEIDASYSPIMNSGILNELAAMPSSTNKMIYVNGSGHLAQTNATTFGVGLFAATDGSNARSIIGAGTSSFSGVYSDLTSKPTLFSGAYSDLTGKPTLFDGVFASLTSKPTTLSGYGITDGVSTSRTITAGTGLSGGGDLSANRTLSLPNTGTLGTYSGVTTDAQGRVTAGTNRSWNNTPGRSIVTGTGATGFQPSSTRDVNAKYGLKVITTATIAGGQEGYVALEIAPTNSATAGDWVDTGARCGNGQTFSLAIALQGVQTTYCQVSATVPAGYYAKLRSINVTGTPTYTYVGGQEMSY